MKRILFVALFVTLGLFDIAVAEMIELKSYKDLNLQQIDQQTLVVFDIDNTLLRQDSMVGTHQWGDYIAERAQRRGVAENAAKEAQYAAFAELQPFVKVIPVENEISEILVQLSQRGISHLALTARAATLQTVTLQQLQVLKHDFSQSFPEMKNAEILQGYLKEGVLFSGATPKGELLKLIIDHSEQKFNRIIFVDDRLYNLESVEKSFVNSSISLRSYRYGAADAMVKSFDPVVADILYSVFKETRALISDDEARLLADNPIRIAQVSFDLFAQSQGPLVQPTESCQEVRYLVVRCDYLFDDEWPASRTYEFSRDSFTGSLYYGNW